MKKIFFLILAFQLVSCEKVNHCSDVIKGKPDHLISEQDLATVKSLFASNNLSLDNFQVYRYQTDDLGYKHVRCFQFINDLNVFSNEVIFHFDKTNHYHFLSGHLISEIDIDPSPKSEQNEIIETFLKSIEDDQFYSRNLRDFEDGCFSCELGYWDLNCGISYASFNFRLSWRIRPTGHDYPFAIINDAENEIIYYDNGIRY